MHRNPAPVLEYKNKQPMPTTTLSQEAATVIEQAQCYAEREHHTLLDSAHLFWALLHHSDAGRDWLSSIAEQHNVLKQLEMSFEHWYTIGTDVPEPSAGYILTIRAAQEHAAASGAHEITTHHLLIAALESDQHLRHWFEQQGIHPPAVRVSPPTPLLDELGRDLTRLARRQALAPVIGRQYEVQQLIEILLRHGKNSALLLGLPGVGKTAVVECLAQDMVTGQVPPKLATSRLIELQVGNLVAGTTYRGELEERLQRLLQELQQTDDVILVIDEFHTLMGAGTTNGGALDAANILKPALARGELTCIGITTTTEYTRYIEKDAAFARRFETVTVSAPSEADTRHILGSIVPRYEQHHSIVVQPGALDAIVQFGAQYLPMRQFPDKALDILGKACSRAEVQRSHAVTPELVTAIVSEMAGVPVGQLASTTQNMLTNLEHHLAQQVIGQETAVTTLAKAVRLAYTGLRDPQRPRGIFLFVGPSGVGKTQLAKSLAELLFGDDKALLRLDMSEYAEKYTVSRLIGAPPGYIGHDEPGQLTQPLRNRPYAVVLLDEIEKAHPDVFDIFLQLFGEGRLTDSHGRPVDGRHAIFIMTSNLGEAHSAKGSLGFERKKSIAGDTSGDNALRAFFRPEFINRIDHIVRFRELDLDDLVEIVALELQTLKIRLGGQNIRLTYERDILDHIASESLQRGAGARGIQRVVEERIAVPISEMLVVAAAHKQTWLHIEHTHGVISLGWV